MRKIPATGVLLGVALLVTTGLSGSAVARWRTANDTAINVKRVCKDGARIKVADYIYQAGELDAVPRDEIFIYHLVVTNPPFIPDPLEDPVPQAPPSQRVFEGDIQLVFDPIDIRLSPDGEVIHYAYSKGFRLNWSRRLTPGTRVAFDLDPTTSDDVINKSKVERCLLG
ncbi:MAG: hypothetical protein H0W21_01845 [Actinobacteria bacterium]|nr:hypothetical protein [Actinomycetota bacterium]